MSESLWVICAPTNLVSFRLVSSRLVSSRLVVVWVSCTLIWLVVPSRLLVFLCPLSVSVVAQLEVLVVDPYTPGSTSRWWLCVIHLVDIR